MDALFFLYYLDLKSLEKKLETNYQNGLTEEKVVQKILKNGYNKLKKPVKIYFFQKIFKQFKDFFVLVLVFVSLVTLFIGIFNKQKEELLEGILILGIVLMNSFLGVFYENQKEQAFCLIQKKTKPYTKVLRNKQLKLVLQEEIVIGDIVFLEAGDIVPADLRLIETNNLKINESLLTGETLGVIKNTQIQKKTYFDLLDAPHLAFMHTLVLSGNAKGVVLYTGNKTQIGQINQFVLKPKKEKTILEKNINQLAKFLSFIIIILVIINFIGNLFYFYLWQGHIANWKIVQKFFLSSIALAVAVIPESLLAIVTIILALGMKKLLYQKAIVKNLKTLENLGATSILCTDKTGTLTKNKMVVQKLFLYSHKFTFKKDLNFDPTWEKLISYGILCNNAIVMKNNNEKKNENTLFDPVDQSLIDLAIFFKIDCNSNRKENVKIKEFPFDAKHKLMITIHQNQKNFLLIIKGASEILLNLSSYVDYNNKIISQSEDIKQNIIKNLNCVSEEGYKVLSIAYVSLPSEFCLKENLSTLEILKKIEKKIIFLGALALEDPIRIEIKKTIQTLKKAFITPIIVTGDHLKTAQNVALRLNIFNPQTDLAITGETLDKLEEKVFLQKLPYIKVYARTNPDHKLKIIQSWQKLGHVVAMIGDGINDAPSIRKADIGISMGISGTAITKQAADVILTDDNFVIVSKAIGEGRKILVNIRKSILFLLSCNMGEICAILLNTFLGFLFFNSPFPLLNALQILWMNLVTDSLVAVALGMENKESDLMQKKPINIQKFLLNSSLFVQLLIEGFMIGFLTLIAAWIGYKIHDNNVQYGQTYAFMVLSLAQLVHVFNFRHLTKSVLSLKPNFYLRKCFFLSFFLQIIILIVPFFKNKFQLAHFICKDYLIIFFFSLIPLFVVEIKKNSFLKKNSKINKRD